MSEQSATGRILVLLDASRASLAALEEAVERAASGQTELHALFVEEVGLLRSAGFPFTREIGAVSGAIRPIDVSAVEAAMRRQAARARRILEQAVAGHHVRYSLSVRRGTVFTEVCTLADPKDLVVLGRVGWSAAPGRMLGSTARALAREAPGSVLLWTMGAVHREGPVVVVVDDFEASTGALAMALSSARARSRPLTVIRVALDDPGATEARDRAVEEWLSGLGAEARLRDLPSLEPRTVARTLRQERASELVLSRRSRLMRDPLVEPILEALTLPVTISA